MEETTSSRFTSRVPAGFMVLVSLLVTLACKGGPREPPAAAGTSIDQRTAVVLPAEDQQAVLREMRQMLEAVGGVMAAAAKGDTAALLAAVAPAGSAAAADPAIEARLPAAWKELAERTHSGFDSLAAAVRRTRGSPALRDTVLVRLAGLSGSCAACHEMFRVIVR